MRNVLTAALCIAALLSAGPVFGYGEMVGTFYNWEERTLHQLINRARVEPASEIAFCGSNCSAAEKAPSCYTPIAPLTHVLSLTESARFHATFMAMGGAIHHDSNCILRSDLAGAYPDACDGAPSCACNAGTFPSPTPHPNNGTTPTDWTNTFKRINAFGNAAQGENIAFDPIWRILTPHEAFYRYLYEDGMGSGCEVTAANRRRFALLKNSGPGVGNGFFLQNPAPLDFDAWWTTDFGSNGPPPLTIKLISGSHWGFDGRHWGDSHIEFSATWHDTAPPSQANLVIDDVAFPMSLERGTTTSGSWSVLRDNFDPTLCYRYYFHFKTSDGTDVFLPTTGSYGVGISSACIDWNSSRQEVAVVGKDDFNRDGRDDILWGHANGSAAFWFLDGTNVAGGGETTSTYPPGTWAVGGTGDFNGDTHTDILRHNTVFGTNEVWFMYGPRGLYRRSVPTASPPWRPNGVGDFDGNGSSDIAWRNPATGENSIWFMNGLTPSTVGWPATVADLAWQMVGAGDTNGDHRADIIWWHETSGSLAVWQMDGTASTSIFIGQVADTLWRPRAVIDANGDGRADVLWHHGTTGSVAVWFLDGEAVTGGGLIGGVPDVQWTPAGGR